MNKNLIVLIFSVAGVILCGAAWFLPPMLQDAQQVVESEASVELERARRLLDEFDATLTYRMILSEMLDDQGIEVEADDLSEDLADDYQQVHSELWEDFPPIDWPEQGEPRPAQARYSNVSTQVRTGLSETLNLADENERKLDDALAAVNRALSVTIGDESSRNHAEATRLKASISFHKGLSGATAAQLKRSEGDRYRRTLAALATVVAESEAVKSLAGDDRIDDYLGAFRSDLDELGGSLDKDRTTLAELNGTISDIEARFLAADARGKEALQTMARIKADGIDFSDSDGDERFAAKLLEQDRAHRKASREAHALMYGDYPFAQIDESADYLAGKYVENGSPTNLTTEHGLLHYQREYAAFAAIIEGRQQAVVVLDQEIAHLEDVKRRYQAGEDRVRERITDATATATEAQAELSRIESEAEVLEDEAIGHFDDAARIAGQAARYADQWISNARGQTEGMSPDAQQNSAFGMRLLDRWMGGYIAALEADARLAKARIYYARYRAASHNAAFLAKTADSLQLAEADIDAERTKAEAAGIAGLTEITAAMNVLESVHGKVERHWTVTAQAAAANDLLALFGQEDYADDALEAYRTAVQGRENQPFVAPFLARINRLENR